MDTVDSQLPIMHRGGDIEAPSLPEELVSINCWRRGVIFSQWCSHWETRWEERVQRIKGGQRIIYVITIYYVCVYVCMYV